MDIRSLLKKIRFKLIMLYLGLRVTYSAWKAGRELGNTLAQQLKKEDRFHSHFHDLIEYRIYEGEPCPICEWIDFHVEK